MKCSSCHAENDDGAKFCRACGQALAPPPAAEPTVACRYCHALNKPGARFCISCGQLMPAPLAATAAPMAAEPFAMADLAAGTAQPAAGQRRTGLALIIGILLLALIAAAAYWMVERQGASGAASSEVQLETQASDSEPVAAQTLEPEAGLEPEAPAPAAGAAPEPAAPPQPDVPAAGAAAPAKAAAAEKKKPTKTERQAPRVKSYDEENYPQPSGPDRTAKAPARAASAGWYVELKAELQRCASGGNFISRAVCSEKAKFRFCGAGNHWGEVPECIKSNDGSNSY